MKLNLFRVIPEALDELRESAGNAGLRTVGRTVVSDWDVELLYSHGASSNAPDWVTELRSTFTELPITSPRNPFGLILATRGSDIFAVTYGRAHFIVRPSCDHDFGIEVAKRIANDEDTALTSAKRFAGRRLKTIRSFAHNSRLSPESGESVEYLQARVLPEFRPIFGRTAKFGSSLLVATDNSLDDLSSLLEKVLELLTTAPRFALPQTVAVVDPAEVAKLDQALLDELAREDGLTDFASNTFDLYGVDFVFGAEGQFTLQHRRRTQDLDVLTIKAVRNFIAVNAIPRDRWLKIGVWHLEPDGTRYRHDLKQELDYISDSQRVALVGGRWTRFNQDYLDFLDEYVRSIEIEMPEEAFAITTLREPAFNSDPAIAAAGYELADKNFDIFVTKSSTPIEAWDLKRDTTVYAVKFGTAQKLGYVCDQATNLLNLFSNRSQVAAVPEFKRYCLWLGYRGRSAPASIADSGSIILKQKIEAWARKAEDLGITPVIKITHVDR